MSVCNFVAVETSKNHGGQGLLFSTFFIVQDVFYLQNIVQYVVTEIFNVTDNVSGHVLDLSTCG